MTITDTTALSPIPTPPETNGHAPNDREMTMLEHLAELRHRLVVMALAVVGGVVFAVIPFPGFDSVTRFVVTKLVERASDANVLLQALRPGETFFTFLEVSLVIGVALAMPVIIYQLLSFVTPALYDNERKYLYIAVPGVTISFAIGVLFCYLVMLPFAIQFLGGFGADLVKPQWAIGNYLNFVTSFLFWVGLTFELPLVMYFLSKLGVVSAQRMAGFRKYAFVLAFVLGAVITPTPDPVNQTIISLPIYILFELGIILARFA